MTEDLELLSPAEAAAAPGSPWSQQAHLLLWCGMAMLTAAGCLGMYRDLLTLWMYWTTDPLRSIGMLIPPASIVLTLRVWRHYSWQMRGTWWGLLVIGLAFFLSALRQRMLFMAVFGTAPLSFIPLSLPVYLYGSGLVLLFAGVQVWRKAWFPLGLLLLSQPVPAFADALIDIPLQNAAARIARSFATLIHFAPTTPQLRLMFSPNFGMFIAPGCDGIRGAVTMGYLALILGYLKRVSWRRWLAYVVGAVLLGYVFNFLRLCILVIYYRIALGHPTLEGMAKGADYAIGSCLFLGAMFIFMRLARLQQQDSAPAVAVQASAGRGPGIRVVCIQCAVFLLLLVAALSVPSPALKYNRASTPTPAVLAARMPKQIGDFVLTRTWYEELGGMIVEENGAYAAPGSDEIILGVWVIPFSYLHDTTHCWLARGLQADLLTTKQYPLANGQTFPFTTGFYSDGITESIVIDALCTSASCEKAGFLYLQSRTGEAAGQHPVSIMVRIDKLHSSVPKQENYDLLAAEAQRFVAGLNPLSLSKAFQ